MLKKMLLLVCAFASFQAISQRVLRDLSALMKTLDYYKFTNYADSLSSKYSDDYYAYVHWLTVNDIFYDYRETYIRVEESYLEDPFEEKYGSNKFDVKIISHCDTIIFYEIVRLKSFKDENKKWIRTETLESTHTDLKSYKKFKINYESIYRAPFNMEDLFIEDMGSIYGFSCGLGGGLLSLRKQLNGFVESKDTTGLFKWLSCAKPILQLYAIDGILTLKKQGIQFDDYVYHIIQIVSIKQGWVSICQGCMVMPDPISDIAEGIFKRHNFSF